MSAMPDKIAAASRAIARILRTLEEDAGVKVSGLALEQLEQVADTTPGRARNGVVLSVRIEIELPTKRLWEVG